MNIQKKTLIQFNNLTLNFEDKVIFNNISASILKHEKIGLIGINGSGKSTLLKCLSGEMNSYFGQIYRSCSIEYVPQINLEVYRKNLPLLRYVEQDYEEWWNVFDKYNDLFSNNISGNQLLSSLSGGELVKLHISIALTKNPELILLDEPTNHLDLNSILKLKEILNYTNISYIVVSHNIDFLDSVTDKTWELENGKLNIYGGNYNFYKNQKSIIFDAKQRKYEKKKKEFAKLTKSIVKEQVRFEKAQNHRQKLLKREDRSTNETTLDFFKNNSEKSTGKKKKSLEQKQKKLNLEIESLKSFQRKNIHFYVKSQKNSGLIISINKANLRVPDYRIIIKNIDFSLYHGDRVAILGNNGYGKTSFVKQLEYKKNVLLIGDIKYGKEYRSMYVDQKYDLVEPNMTLFENIQKNNNKIGYENIRQILGNFGFEKESDISRKSDSLSGGEVARLAFAIATSAEIDLLILDEPTNNIDIDTINVIIEALQSFKGTILVVSHDLHFLKKIGILKYIEIVGKKLVDRPI